jgi:hypothetical protein
MRRRRLPAEKRAVLVHARRNILRLVPAPRHQQTLELQMEAVAVERAQFGIQHLDRLVL